MIHKLGWPRIVFIMTGIMATFGVSVIITACATVPQEAKPDVHLSFDIRSGGENTMTFEVAVHPLLDPLIHNGLDLVRQMAPEGTGKPMIELQDTKREGRKYSAIVMQFTSLDDLNAFVNTPQLLSGLLSLFTPGTEVPPLFTKFRAWHDQDSREGAYGVEGLIDSDTTSALTFIKMTIHLRLPGEPQQHNADKRKDGELSWQVVPGKQLEMQATSSGSSSPVGSQVMSLISHPILWLGGGLSVLLLLAAGGFLAYRRASSLTDEEW